MKKILALVAFLGLVAFLPGCRNSCGPCGTPCAPPPPACAPKPRPCPQPCRRPCPSPCASRCNQANPGMEPPPPLPPPPPPPSMPPGPPTGGCGAALRPCTCAPTWGTPNVRAMAAEIAEHAQWHSENCPPALKAAWDQLVVDANAAKNHNPCSKYSCDYWRQIVAGYHATVTALQGASGAIAPECTELNHPD